MWLKRPKMKVSKMFAGWASDPIPSYGYLTVNSVNSQQMIHTAGSKRPSGIDYIRSNRTPQNQRTEQVWKGLQRGCYTSGLNVFYS